MPYSTKTTAACPISKPWGVIKDGTAQVMGCHSSESDAQDQIAALYASEEIQRAKYDDIDFTPPKGVREEAQQGLDWRSEHGRGGTAVGIARARDLSNGKDMSPDTIRRMVSYFSRHEVDKKGEGWSPGEDGFPSNGRIAWALWGGDPGQAWSAKVSRSMDARDKAERISKMPRVKRSFDGIKDGRAIIATETPIEIYDETRGWLKQVLLMDGVQFRNDKRQLPIVDSHNDKTVRNVFGSIRNIRIEGGALIGDPEFASDVDSQIVATRFDEGHLTDFSIDAVIIERKYLRDGEQYVTKSGVVIQGPAEIVTRWEPHNASICATGADPNSTVRRSYSEKEIERMDPELMAQLKSLGLPEDMTDPMAIIGWMADHMAKPELEIEAPEEPAVVESMASEDKPKVESMDQKVQEEVSRQLKAEKVRRETIYCNVKLARLERSFADELIDEGVSIPVANERIIRKMATQPIGTSVPSPHVQVTESSDDKFAAAMSAGLVKRAFTAAKIKADTPDAPGAEEFAKLNLRRMAALCVERMGIKTDRLGDVEIARIAMGSVGVSSRYRIQRDAYHTSGSFPQLMLDAANKTLRNAYEEAPYSWSVWARQAPSVDDFKNINRIAFGESPNLEMVPETKPYPQKSIGDLKTSYKVEKYGAMFSVSWETVVNDDLDAISRVPAMHGNAARRTQNKAVYDVLFANPTMADGVALFSASHASGRNINSASAGAPSVTTLNEAFRFMGLQKGQTTDVTLNVVPRYLIVPQNYAATALELVNSSSYAVSNGNSGIVNIYGVNGSRPLTVVADALLDGNSTTNWYLAADSSQIDTVEITFLSGEESPVLENEVDFDTDCYRYKVRQTFGCAAIDWRGLYSNR